jgi:peptide/nickel transport system substrate-binding protein
MKKKIVFSLVIVFVVFSLALFAGGKKEVTGAATATTDEPQYGGTISFLQYRAYHSPTSWDQFDGGWPELTYLSPVLDRLIKGDEETYGPRGTNGYSFQIQKWVPDEFMSGQLAERWEMTTSTATETA